VGMWVEQRLLHIPIIDEGDDRMMANRTTATLDGGGGSQPISEGRS